MHGIAGKLCIVREYEGVWQLVISMMSAMRPFQFGCVVPSAHALARRF